jgi:hypothetical protein
VCPSSDRRDIVFPPVTFKEDTTMPTLIMLQTKNTPKVSDFMRECGQLMQIKGFQFISQPSNPNIFYVNYILNMPMTELNSLLKQIKAISSFSQSITNIYIGHNMRKG